MNCRQSSQIVALRAFILITLVSLRLRRGFGGHCRPASRGSSGAIRKGKRIDSFACPTHHARKTRKHSQEYKRLLIPYHPTHPIILTAAPPPRSQALLGSRFSMSLLSSFASSLFRATRFEFRFSFLSSLRDGNFRTPYGQAPLEQIDTTKEAGQCRFPPHISD